MQILGVIAEPIIDFAVILFNSSTHHAKVPNQSGIFLPIHGFVIFHFQLALLKKRFGTPSK